MWPFKRKGLHKVVRLDRARKDCKGREISEGDIVRFRFNNSLGFLGSDDGTGVCVVEFNEERNEWAPWAVGNILQEDIRVLGVEGKDDKLLQPSHWPKCKHGSCECKYGGGEMAICLLLEDEKCPKEGEA